MASLIEVDDQTYRSLEFAARMAKTTTGEVVARLVAQASVPETTAAATDAKSTSASVNVYADYDGHRTRGVFDPTTSRIDITSGSLAGRSFKTPTGAARAIVTHHNPGVNPNRNGWLFWMLDDGSGKTLKTIQRSR